MSIKYHHSFSFHLDDRSVLTSQPTVKSKKKEKFVRARYDYEAQHKDELDLREGE